MNDIFSNTQIPLPLNVPDDFCIDDSAQWDKSLDFAGNTHKREPAGRHP